NRSVQYPTLPVNQSFPKRKTPRCEIIRSALRRVGCVSPTFMTRLRNACNCRHTGEAHYGARRCSADFARQAGPVTLRLQAFTAFKRCHN
ncbi:hypothetical protein, partial [Desulfobacter hydrogenophilus]|uniref:hypothetical protein n=1 Tax=Desulfobacter hydrogenophilus TaxID=2291 RepID=UPI001BA4DB66